MAENNTGEDWIKKPGKETTPIKLTSGRYLEGTKNYLVKLADINNRNQAEDLRSAELLVPADNLLPLDPGEFHVNDLIGLEVVVQSDGTELGLITNVFTTGHDLLEVTLHNQVTDSHLEAGKIAQTESVVSEKATEKESSIRAKAAEKLRRKARRSRKKKKPKPLLIPFVEDIVPVVDISSGRIEITPPPGLTDL